MIELTTLALIGALSAAPDPAAHRAEIEQWRQQRVERLTAPTGWLSLVGLHWLPRGLSVIGHGDGATVDLGRGPAELATLSWEGDRFYLKARQSGLQVGEQEILGTELRSDAEGAPTLVQFGDVQFYLIKRGERFGLRVKDAQAPTRVNFGGIDYFDINPAWRIEARFEPHDPPRTMAIATVAGNEEDYPNPGRVVFQHDGTEYSLEALEEEGTDDYFFIVYDGTSGKETYGMARFMYAAPPVDGKIVMDFNKLYNPPCAFTEFSTCPLPPTENRLRLRITAGEKAYHGADHG